MRIKTITKLLSAVLSASILAASVPTALLAEPAVPVKQQRKEIR